MYRDKLNSNTTSTKKRSYKESEEDGFKELLSVEEEEEVKKDEDINDLANKAATMSL